MNKNLLNKNLSNKKLLNENLIKKIYLIKKKRYDEFRNKEFKILYNKQINSIIPLNIFQYWHSNELPLFIENCTNNIKNNNKEFNYQLFNENSAINFIRDNFSAETLDCFNSIIPSAIKADLFRYCILYKLGGIYIDVKYSCINNFKLIYLTDTEYFCKDIDTSGGGVYNALIICKPNNDILMNCINKVILNTKNKYYGNSALEPTGPLMMKKFFSYDEINNFKLRLNVEDNNFYITFKKLPILYFHKKHRNKQNKISKYYAECWKDRQFYL